MQSISEYLAEDYKKWKDKPYIWTKQEGKYQCQTFGQTIEDVYKTANWLLNKGLGGKNIIIYAPNSYAWMVLDLAIMGYVGTCMPIDKEWTTYDLNHVMSALEVGAVLYSSTKEKEVTPLKAHYPVPFICIEEEFPKMVAEQDTISPVGITDLEYRSQILFTSGTTDIPKAIQYTQHNMFANWDTLYQRTPMVETDVSYLFLPLNHAYSGVANFLYTIISGMEIYLCSDYTHIAEEMLAIHPTVVCMVPLILRRFYDCMTEEMLQCFRGIRFLYCGGSFTEPAIKRYFKDQGVALIEAYGTSETASVIALDVIGDTNYEANGVIFENLTVKVLEPDEEGIGEILVKGESRSAGYLLIEDVEKYFDKEGYYHTGDLGRVDATRHLYLKGRKRRVIIRENGKNVYVDELENMILANTAIHKVKVYEEEHRIEATIYTDQEEYVIREYIEEINTRLAKFKKINILHVFQDSLGSRMK